MANKSIKEESYYKNFHKFINEAEYSDEQLAAELEKAFKAGPSETRAFLNGPMGQSPELRAMLTKADAQFDGNASDDKVKVGSASGPCSAYEPTQNYIDLMQSVGYPLGSAKQLVQVISNPVAQGVVTSGKYIIDGHHRWSGAFAIGGSKATINGKNVEWPGQNAKEMLAAAQLAIAATMPSGGKQPTKGGSPKTNILGKGAGDIAQMIMDNINKQVDPNAPGPMLNDAMMKDLTEGDNKFINVIFAWLGPLADRVKEKVGPGKSSSPEAIYQLRLAIATKIGENLSGLPQPTQAPPREDMPQFDTKAGGPELTSVEPSIGSGKFNISPPFTKESVIEKRLNKYLKESINTLNIKK